MELCELQEQQRVWAFENFGDEVSIRKSLEPTLGVAEELGELAEAIDGFDADAAADAVGDVVIYLADVCTRSGWSLEVCERLDASEFATTVEAAFTETAKHIGRLCHSRLKPAQGIRQNEDHEAIGQEAVGSILGSLEFLCIAADLDFEQVVEDAWTKVVRKRDWNAERAANAS